MIERQIIKMSIIKWPFVEMINPIYPSAWCPLLRLSIGTDHLSTTAIKGHVNIHRSSVKEYVTKAIVKKYSSHTTSLNNFILLGHWDNTLDPNSFSPV